MPRLLASLVTALFLLGLPSGAFAQGAGIAPNSSNLPPQDSYGYNGYGDQYYGSQGYGAYNYAPAPIGPGAEPYGVPGPYSANGYGYSPYSGGYRNLYSYSPGVSTTNQETIGETDPLALGAEQHAYCLSRTFNAGPCY